MCWNETCVKLIYLSLGDLVGDFSVAELDKAGAACSRCQGTSLLCVPLRGQPRGGIACVVVASGTLP